MGALVGDPRANAHYMDLHKEDVAMRATACVKILHYDLRSRHVCSLPGAVVQLLSQSPHLNACTPKVSSILLPKAPVYPLQPPPPSPHFDSRL
jgi:hypothetical protein